MILTHAETLFNNTAVATGDTSATPIVTKYDKEMIVFLDITAVAGANPTLGIAIKVYNGVSQSWFPLCSFTQKTTTGQDVGYVEYGIGERIAVFYTIGGVDPSFTFSLSVQLKNQ